MNTRAASGFTLIEVMVAMMILGVGLTVLLNSLGICIRMVEYSKARQQVQYVFTLGELKHPIPEIKTTIEDDLTVDPDYDIEKGFSFERTVDEKEDPEDNVVDDRLYVVRTLVSWNDGHNKEEVIRYVRAPQQ